ncbi:E3 ubiquitin ligase Rnf157-like [Paramacrobiotus metropolitanus]|uniref:E3 ubiquitin ligase Rnf157-like n=1 Tax=Paramacrobiotus metropolitanus TaxID=2943436 RepID=UPI0024461A25|nr:E3 ubiquitin ligase Rnf157-like [Paramacrobiotus metropolitanus]XP_055343946.1 E3 ubiquitin ligase Rnf157-like [Paramacrobiotus metropolitanus]
MGAILSRTSRNPESSDPGSLANAFRYPPKAGSYFATQFIMGGERFDSPQPEAYLFGDNNDLNFLNTKPVPFPYVMPSTNDLAKPLKCVVNIRRESLRLVRILNDYGMGTGYNLEFNFDVDVPCYVRIMYFAKEDATNHSLSYTSRDTSLNSEKFYYKAGANQLFNQVSHVFDPSRFSEDELLYNEETEVIPVVIQCATEDEEDGRQCHATLAVIEKSSDGTYSLKALKQKLYIQGLVYLLQEVYGIENKTAGSTEYDSGDEEYEDSSGDCVVCMSDTRDTLILPCRHLCLCNGCAESLRYQANNCPICRAPFRALLQIRALQKKELGAGDHGDADENVPSGYEVVSLIEALNGPNAVHPTRHQRSSLDSPTLSPKGSGPRHRKRSKKPSIPKIVAAGPSGDAGGPVSPGASSLKSSGGKHVTVVHETEPQLEPGSPTQPQRLRDHIEVITEIPSRSIIPVRHMDDEEDNGKDSDQTTDSNSSARSFNTLLRHGSRESINEPDDDKDQPDDEKETENLPKISSPVAKKGDKDL